MATSFAVALVAILGSIGLFVYGHEMNRQIVVMQRAAYQFSERAAERGDAFPSAVMEFEQSIRREGIHTYAFGPGTYNQDEVALIDGVQRVNWRASLQARPIGYVIASLFGVRFVNPQPFLDGTIGFTVDAGQFQNAALAILATMLLVGGVAGIFAFAFGRYVAAQAIRPLVEVTEALQRFAARDFEVGPIVTVGRSDFDVLADAYNAAASQVTAAFAERDAAEHQMRQFVADAGHELRTPLTIILGYIDVLRKRMLSDDARSQMIFRSIASEGRRMRVLVDNLVLLARLEADDTRPIEPFDVGALVNEIVELRRGLDPSVRIEIDALVRASAIAHRDDVHEAFANIVDNAIKYAPGSPIHIVIMSQMTGVVEVRFADEGPGIAREDRDSVFERFYRGAARGEVEGSGLGLAIAKRVVERAGGSLRLEPAERGTTFVVSLRADQITPAETSIRG